MRFRTFATLMLLNIWLTFPHALWWFLRGEGVSTWARILIDILLVAPALLLAWWWLDRESQPRCTCSPQAQKEDRFHFVGCPRWRPFHDV